MNVLLLGNAFDINYKLSTKYAIFLHVANYIANQETKNINTIGDILSQEAFQRENPFIKTRYETHKHKLAEKTEQESYAQLVANMESHIV